MKPAPRQRSAFIGREAELARLRQSLGDALKGSGRLELLMGEPGIGKTRLAEELAAYAEKAGARVLWGRCYEEQGTPPYWPWVQAMDPYFEQVEAKKLRKLVGPLASPLAVVFPRVRGILQEVEQFRDEGAGPAATAFRLHHAASTFVVEASREIPLAIVLEDLHWADESSLGLLVFLTRELAGAHVLLLGTYRDVELGEDYPLARSLGALARENLYDRQKLRGWSPEETAEFVAQSAAAPVGVELVGRIQELTDGNPLFCREMARVAAGPDGRLPARLPEGIREAVTARLRRVSPDCSELLATAAAIGPEPAVSQLGRVMSDWPRERLLEALEQASAAGVLEESEPRGRYRFVHAVYRETIAQSLSLARRVKLHARVAEALEELYGSAGDEHADELAMHFSEAQSILGPDRAVRYALLAGRKSLDAYAAEQALAHFQRGLDACTELPHDERYAELCWGAGVASSRLYRTEEAYVLLSRAIDAWEKGGHGERAAGALAREATLAIDYVPMAALLERGLVHAAPGTPERAMLLASLAMCHSTLGRDPNCGTTLSEALEIASRLGDSGVALRVHAKWAQVAWFANDWDAAESHCRSATELARASASPYELLHALHTLTDVLMRRGELTEARLTVETRLKVAESLGDRWCVDHAYIHVASLCLDQGDWEGVRSASRRSLANPFMRSYVWFHMCPWVTETLTGNHDEAARILAILREQSRASADPASAWSVYAAGTLAASAAVTGDNDALAEADRMARAALSRPSMPLIFSSVVHGTLALIAFLRDDAEAARPLYQDRSWFVPGACEGSFLGDGALGRLALTLGLRDEAVEHFRASRERIRHRLTSYLWGTGDLGIALRKRNASGDREEAERLQREVLAAAEDHGMPPVAARARREIDLLSPAATSRPAGLTDREAEILRFVAAGKTDKEIAFALHISAKTASNHVGNILKKVGAGNRTEAARFAARHGLAE